VFINIKSESGDLGLRQLKLGRGILCRKMGRVKKKYTCPSCLRKLVKWLGGVKDSPAHIYFLSFHYIYYIFINKY